MAAVSTVGRASQIERSARPAADAAQALFERHSSSIFRYCLSQLRSRTEAEDAVQTTFVYALRALDRGVVPQIEIAWLLKIAQNVCRTQRKTAARRAKRELASDPTVLAAIAVAPDRLNAELMGMDEALAGLPENQRRAVLLREWQGLSYAEIAATMGVSQAAVEMLLFRARRGLAEALGDEGGRRRRIAQLLDLGWLGGWLKSLGGMSAAKAVAGGAAAVVTVGALAAGAQSSEGPAARSPRNVQELPAQLSSVAGEAGASTQAKAASGRADGPSTALTPLPEATHGPSGSVAQPEEAPSDDAKPEVVGAATATETGGAERPGAASDEPPASKGEAPVRAPDPPAVPSLPEPELPLPVQPPALPTPELPGVPGVTESIPDLPIL